MTKNFLFLMLPLWVSFVQVASVQNAGTAAEVPYPSGYRLWTHVKTGIVGPNTPAGQRYAGYHHIYANEKAMAGYQSGTFADGAMIVFDVLETIQKENGNIPEGKRKFIDVMVKDSKKFESTGGWGFEEFNENSETERILSDTAKKQCFGCHASQEKKGFVFSSFRK